MKIGMGLLGCIAGLVCLAGLANAQNWFLRRAPSQAHFPVQRCINMGGGLEADHEGDWGYRFEQRHFAAIKSAGFDTVRIPVKWSAHAANTAPYQIDPAFLARVDDIVRWGSQQGLNVIINVHHYDELYADPDAHTPRLLAIWGQLARHYRTAGPNLMFEIINEPRDAFSGQRVNQAQADALGIIRQTNPQRTVILAGDAWGSIEGMHNLRLPDDPYVVATVHYYGPYEFTHQGASWLPNPPPAGRAWPIDGDLEQLNRDVARIQNWQRELNVPVLLGEYGVDAGVPHAGRVSWTADVTAALDRANIPGCYFNFAAGFYTYDLQTQQFDNGLLRALGLK